MGAVFCMCPHLFLYPGFCILAGNLLALGHKKKSLDCLPTFQTHACF